MIGRRIAVLLGAALVVAPTAQAQTKEGCIRAVTSATDRPLAQSAPGMIALGQGARVVLLEPVCASGSREMDVLQGVASAPARRRFLLVIEDLRAEVQPGVLFDLELAPAESHGDEAVGRSHLIGTLNFFAAQRPGVAARPRRVSYDVTNALHALAAGGRRSSALSLTIRPATAPATASDAAIGRIALVKR